MQMKRYPNGVDPAAFTLETMRNRMAQVGDPTAGMWRRKVSLASRFVKLGLDPPEREEPRAE